MAINRGLKPRTSKKNLKASFLFFFIKEVFADYGFVFWFFCFAVGVYEKVRGCVVFQRVFGIKKWSGFCVRLWVF